jgi:heme-binding protein
MSAPRSVDAASGRPRRSRARRIALIAGSIAIGVLLVLQIVPYGHDHGAPPTTKRAVLEPAAARVAAAACMDCHSNATRWPWYTDIAPASFLAVSDVKGGREHMNLSRWDTPQPDLGEVVDSIAGGDMAPGQYKLIHRGARLTAAQRRTLIAGFRALYATDPPPVGGG